jgi:hypothetical protein
MLAVRIAAVAWPQAALNLLKISHFSNTVLAEFSSSDLAEGVISWLSVH